MASRVEPPSTRDQPVSPDSQDQQRKDGRPRHRHLDPVLHRQSPCNERAQDQREGHAKPQDFRARSEEHTSELQTLMRNSYAVFCLNKKKNLIEHTYITSKKL